MEDDNNNKKNRFIKSCYIPQKRKKNEYLSYIEETLEIKKEEFIYFRTKLVWRFLESSSKQNKAILTEEDLQILKIEAMEKESDMIIGTIKSNIYRFR